MITKFKLFESKIIENMWDQETFFPMAPKSSLALYYQCMKCHYPFISINKKLDTCDVCGSHKLKFIEEEEFYKILKSQVSPEDWKIVQLARREADMDMMDLTKLNPMDSPRAHVN